jgi:hypothetical protein
MIIAKVTYAYEVERLVAIEHLAFIALSFTMHLEHSGTFYYLSI